MTPAQQRTFDATSCSLFGIMIAAVLLGSLALRSVTAEYASGMIRSTFTAMPTRRLVLAGKAAIVAAFAFPVVLVSNFVAFEIGQRIFAAKHLQVTLGHPGVLTAIFFGAVAVSLIAVIGVGLGGVIRHTAGATAAMAVVIVGGVTFGQLLPAGLRGYLPGTALQAAVTVHARAGSLRQARPSWSSGCMRRSRWRRLRYAQHTATPDSVVRPSHPTNYLPIPGEPITATTRIRTYDKTEIFDDRNR
jgi:hypothetical protein